MLLFYNIDPHLLLLYYSYNKLDGALGSCLCCF